VGLQVSRDVLRRLLGCSRRGLDYALRALEARGLIERQRVLVSVPAWIDATGVERTRADVYAVMLPTAAGLDVVRKWGTELAGLRDPTLASTHRLRKRRGVRGLVGFLLNRLAGPMRRAARRCEAASEGCTPRQYDVAFRRTAYRGRQLEVVENGRSAARRVTTVTTTTRPTALGGTTGGHHDAAAAFRAEVERCWAEKRLTPATAYPELWSIQDEQKAARRVHLTRQFAPIRRVLTLRIEAERGHPDFSNQRAV
jgi:hypothetical protein